MFNLFDLTRQAQGGAALDNMARQFGLSPEQTQRAVAYMLPAFAMGLQHRAATDPGGLARFFGGLAGNPVLTFFDQPGRAFGAPALTTGSTLVDALLGSSQLGQQVVQQASVASGIGTGVLRQMLPVLAGLVAAGLVHAALNPPPGLLPPYLDPFGAARPVPRETPRRDAREAGGASDPLPWGEFVANLFAAPDAAPRAGTSTAAAPDPAPRSASSGAAGDAAGDAAAALALPLETMSRLMQAGNEAQERHLTALHGLFDAFWGAAARRPGGSGPGAGS